jgi:hypothetical protein
MDFGKVLSRAWEITWRWKVLWVFGFLISLGQGWSRGSRTFDWIEDRRGGEFLEHLPPGVVGLLISLACVGLLIGIALWVLSVIGRGALVGGVQQVEEEGSTDLGRAWRVGVSRFWTLFGISILTGLPVLVLALMIVAAFVGPVLAEVGISAGRDAPTGIFGLSFLCGVPLCCIAIVAGIVLSQIKIYADRAAVLEGLGWIDAFRRSWEVLRDNLGPTVVLWLIFFAIGLVLVIVVGGGLLVLLLPFFASVVSADPGAWILLPVACGGLLVVVVPAVIGSVVETFTSATWTLAYREMIGPSVSLTDVEPVAG